MKKARRDSRRKAAAARPAPAPPALTREALAAWTERDRRYWPAVALTVAVALGLRLFRLGVPIFAADEAIYATFARNLHEYTFDPVYHGPTLYYLLKLFFVLFGESDFVARSLSVLMGMITIALVLGPGRRWMGARAALGSAVLLAISPVLVTYERRIFYDALVVALTFGCVLCLQSILAGRGRRWRWRSAWILLVSLLTFFLATKANAFFVVAMLGGFWLMAHLRGMGRRDAVVALPTQLPLLLFIAVSVASALALRDDPQSIRRNEAMLQIVGAAAALLLWEWLRRTRTTETRLARPRPDMAAIGLSVLAAALLFAFFYGKGYEWHTDIVHAIPRHWADITGAMPKMLHYWGGQQKEPRLPGRHDFYLTLMIAYELPILVAAVCGIVRASRQRTRFTDLLLWWSFTSYTLYAIANEKVPWLATNVVLPLALIGGWWLGQVRFRGALARRAFAIACVLGGAFLLRNVSATCYERALDNREPMFYAGTNEAFSDTLRHGIEVSRRYEGDMWIHNAWPASWYLRDSAVQFPGVAINWDENIPANLSGHLRLIMCKVPDWETIRNRYPGYHLWTWEQGRGVVADVHGEDLNVLLHPRLSWTSLRPDKWARWFVTREAPIPDAPDAFLTEWSNVAVVVATPP